MIANWKLIAFMLYTVAIWHAHSVYDRAKDADRLAARQAAVKAEMRATFEIDKQFNEAIADLGTFQTHINQSIEHETPLPDCRLTAGRVSALRQAIAGDPAAR